MLTAITIIVDAEELNIHQAPSRWRLKLSKNPSCGPFVNQRFLLFVSKTSERETYSRIIQAGGGEVLNKKGEHPKKTDSRDIAIVDRSNARDDPERFATLVEAGVPCLDPEYLFRSVVDPLPVNIESLRIPLISSSKSPNS